MSTCKKGVIQRNQELIHKKYKNCVYQNQNIIQSFYDRKMRWSFRKSSKPETPLSHSRQLYQLRQDDRIYGVKIHACSCKAGAKFAGYIFALGKVPQLPLKDCDASICSCEYLGVPDRRKQVEQRSGKDRRFSIRLAIDRRLGRDRREARDFWKGLDR